MRIGSIRQEELWQSTTTGEKLCGLKKKAVASIPDNEDRIAQAWVNVVKTKWAITIFFFDRIISSLIGITLWVKNIIVSRKKLTQNDQHDLAKLFQGNTTTI